MNGKVEQLAHKIVRPAAPRLALYAICQNFLIGIADTVQACAGNPVGSVSHRPVDNRYKLPGLRSAGIKCVFVFFFAKSIWPCADAKPALLLEKIEKYNLAHKLFCKLG